MSHVSAFILCCAVHLCVFVCALQTCAVGHWMGSSGIYANAPVGVCVSVCVCSRACVYIKRESDRDENPE